MLPHPPFEQLAREVRKKLIVMHANSKSSHIGTAFSCVDLLVALYFHSLKIYPGQPLHEDRDRFILSKGHGASALYVTLALKGLLPQEALATFHLDGGQLPGHPSKVLTPFIEHPTGSLGHGLPVGVGIAYALKLKRNKAKAVVLMSDGEIQEGSVWEAANAASRFRLNNLVALVDANGLQGYEQTDHIMPFETFRKKWEAFGWAVHSVDGHRFDQMITALDQLPFHEERPSMIIAKTTKGKGVKEFEGKLEWHYKSPLPEKIQDYLLELDEERVRS